MADDVEVKFSANTAALAQATSLIQSEFAAIQSAAGQLTSSFSLLGGATGLLASALTTLGLESFVRHMADSGIEANKLKAALGITGSQFLDLKAAASLSGTEIGALGLSIERMSLQIQRSTRDAFSPQAEALKVLGLNAKDLIGLRADEYFSKITAAVSKFNPSLNLTNALMAIGGRSMANMVAAFTQGSDEVKKFEDEMARTKVGIEGFYTAASETHRELVIMDSAINGLNKQLFLALKPTFEILIIRAREFAIEVRQSIKDGGGWSYAVDTIVVSLKGFVQIMNLAITAVSGFAIIAKESWKFVLDGSYTFEALRERAKALSDSLAELGNEQLRKFKELWLSTNEELKRKPLGIDVPAMEQEGRKGLEVLMTQIDNQIKMVELGFEKQKLIYEGDVGALGITELQKTKLVQDASQQRYAEEVTLLQRKLQLGGLDIAQRAQIEAAIKQLTQTRVNDQLKFENDYVKQVQGEWGTLFNTLQSSWAGQLRGLLQGTTTWKNAMKAIFTDLVVFAIQKFTELAIIKPIIESLSKAFAPTEIFADILKVISKMIGQVFSGATAFFAPTLGPAAPAAGAAVAAATEATALSYDIGAWSVPQTARALVHRDEMIIPVDFASAIRTVLTGGSAAGAGSTAINISAWDGASVQRWLRSGGSAAIAKALQGHYNENPSSRPSY